MAIGLDLKLLPMLHQFSRVCLPELGARRLYFYLPRDEAGLPFKPAAANRALPVPLAGFPREAQHLVHPNPAALLQLLTQQGRPWHQEFDAEGKTFEYWFTLDNFGLVSLHGLTSPLGAATLAQLVPIFSRLALGCTACITHEQMLRIASVRQESDQSINFKIFHDELTTLPNRRMLMDHLAKDIARSKRHGFFGAVLFLDLNRFKVINDTFGHSTGDLLLVKVAQILQGIVRKEDTVARLSGDEFVIQLSRIKASRKEAEEAVSSILEKIHHAFSTPLKIDEHTLHVTPSIGVEIYPNGNATADEILNHADIAMYQAKSQGPNVSAFFDQQRSDEIKLRLKMEKELKDALETMAQFHLYYQPQFTADGTCVGAEALLRWISPERGYISPARFIPIAEETGLMMKLGQWVLEQACKDLAVLEKCGLPERFRKLSVNVSAIQFNQKSFVANLLATIEKHDISREYLGIELTESTLIKNINDTVDMIAALKDNGITTSIDDFGTGYSSLAYLTRFPIETLKIDQMFVRNIDSVKGNRDVVDTIMVLGKNLKLSIIAEGVETEAELKCLREFNCEYYQGYYFKCAIPFDEFRKLLAEEKVKTRAAA
jgi:diguanylate cyclase (GGDEF)-like protein